MKIINHKEISKLNRYQNELIFAICVLVLVFIICFILATARVKYDKERYRKDIKLQQQNEKEAQKIVSKTILPLITAIKSTKKEIDEAQLTSDIMKTFLPTTTLMIDRVRKVVIEKYETKQDVLDKLNKTLNNYTICFLASFQKQILDDSHYELTFHEIEQEIRDHCLKEIFGIGFGFCEWPTSYLVGPLAIRSETLNLTELKKELPFIYNGGWWKPEHCIPRHRVAVIVPFRDRDQHLYIFLRHLHNILKRQELSYRILIIEQSDEYPFNRGKLMNVGYVEALKIAPFSCFVFHDVDLLPENDLNFYGCITSPRHMSVAIDKFDYKLPYKTIFGGVEMFTRSDFQKINGFPNGFWGWGAEDDNLYKRVVSIGLTLTRPSPSKGRYQMLKHLEAADRPPNRHDKLNNAVDEMQIDGLSSLQYTFVEKTEQAFHTHIKVDLNMEDDMIY